MQALSALKPGTACNGLARTKSRRLDTRHEILEEIIIAIQRLGRGMLRDRAGVRRRLALNQIIALMISCGPAPYPTRQPVIACDLESPFTVSVRSAQRRRDRRHRREHGFRRR